MMMRFTGVSKGVPIEPDDLLIDSDTIVAAMNNHTSDKEIQFVDIFLWSGVHFTLHDPDRDVLSRIEAARNLGCYE